MIHLDIIWYFFFYITQKFYAEVTGSGDESNETRFFKRVFPVGREGRHVIVLPYNNTDDREHLELLAPFATEVFNTLQ